MTELDEHEMRAVIASDYDEDRERLMKMSHEEIARAVLPRMTTKATALGKRGPGEAAVMTLVQKWTAELIVAMASAMSGDE